MTTLRRLSSSWRERNIGECTTQGKIDGGHLKPRILLPGNNRETVLLLFFSRTEDEVLPVLSSCKFRRQLLDLLRLFFSVPQSAGSAVLSQLAFSKLLLPHNWPPCSSLRFLNANRFVFQQTLIRQKLGRRSWRWCWKPGISSTSPEGSSTRATASLTLTRCTSPSPLTRRTAGGICCKR